MIRSKSALFLMEFIIIIAFFSMATAVCMQIFAHASRLSAHSHNLKMAVVHAQNAAESFKSSGADTEEMAAILGATTSEGYVLYLHFDEEWGHTTAQDPHFAVQILVDTSSTLASAQISITDTWMGQELYSLKVLRYLGVE